MPDIDELRASLKEGVLEMREVCLKEIQDVIQRKRAISDVTREASKMIQHMLRIDQEVRLGRENAASLSLRFIQMIDGDDKMRKDYMDKTAPRMPMPLIEGKKAKKK